MTTTKTSYFNSLLFVAALAAALIAPYTAESRSKGAAKSSSASAPQEDNILQSIDSLGSNRPLVEKAKAIDGDSRVRVVQNRIVDRDLRLELGVNYGLTGGGDSYVTTQALGFMGDFHIVPQFSVGVRHFEYYNDLTNEGRRVFDDAKRKAEAGQPYTRPDVDYALSSTMGIVTVYPLYGKLNFFNIGVTQFDLYILGGYGNMRLNSGNTGTWTAGGGVGIWWTNLISSRIEVRQQGYEDKIYTGTRQQGVTHFTAGVGFLL